MILQRSGQGFRQYGGTVFVALSSTNRDRPEVEVNIFYSQSHAFIDSQASPIEEFGH
jgi:hypothetical protein